MKTECFIWCWRGILAVLWLNVAHRCINVPSWPPSPPLLSLLVEWTDRSGMRASAQHRAAHRCLAKTGQKNVSEHHCRGRCIYGNFCQIFVLMFLNRAPFLMNFQCFCFVTHFEFSLSLSLSASVSYSCFKIWAMTYRNSWTGYRCYSNLATRS